MTTTFLRFVDEAAFLAALAAVGITEEQTTLADGTAIDVIGTLHEPVILADDGETVLSGGALSPGWHVNLAGTLPVGWEEYLVTPLHPQRIFAS